MSAGRMLALIPQVAFGTVRGVWKMQPREFFRALLEFGLGSFPLALAAGALTGALVIVQTGMYVERFGARAFLGWAAGYALLREFGPLMLGIVLASRLGARNAAELATLSVGGQIEGLRGVALDPMTLLVAPRVVGITLSMAMLSAAVFTVGILTEALTALWTVQIPVRVFLDNFAHTLSEVDFLAGMLKSTCFGAVIAIVSTASGLSAEGGARDVGNAAATAVVASCAWIFTFDLLLTMLLIRVTS